MLYTADPVRIARGHVGRRPTTNFVGNHGDNCALTGEVDVVQLGHHL